MQLCIFFSDHPLNLAGGKEYLGKLGTNLELAGFLFKPGGEGLRRRPPQHADMQAG